MGRGPNGIVTTAPIDVPERRGICQTVIEAIADAEDTEPSELTPPLFEVIDPDALDTLFARNQAVGKIIFNYNSYEISVFPDGYVSIEDHGA